MTSAQVVETSVNVISNSPSQDYTHPDDRTLPYRMSLSRRAKSELEWWVVNVMTAKNVMTRGAPLYTLTTDASNEGWGGGVRQSVNRGLLVLSRKGFCKTLSCLDVLWLSPAHK